jgi:hypothetical protein
MAQNHSKRGYFSSTFALTRGSTSNAAGGKELMQLQLPAFHSATRWVAKTASQLTALSKLSR